MLTDTSYTFRTIIGRRLPEARSRVEAALREEGFGVLTEIDVAATLKAKLGVSLAPYVILGACNPPLAHRALEADPAIGALLPCNVVLREEGGETIVEALDPNAAMGIVDVPAVRAVSDEARLRLRRALSSLET
jgi:uncharacterized protein (DUF302 family)